MARSTPGICSAGTFATGAQGLGAADPHDLVGLGGDRREVGVDHLDLARVRDGDAQEFQPGGGCLLVQRPHRRVERLPHRRLIACERETRSPPGTFASGHQYRADWGNDLPGVWDAGTGERSVQFRTASAVLAELGPGGTPRCCSGCPARSCCGSPTDSCAGCCSSSRHGSPAARPESMKSVTVGHPDEGRARWRGRSGHLGRARSTREGPRSPRSFPLHPSLHPLRGNVEQPLGRDLAPAAAPPRRVP